MERLSSVLQLPKCKIFKSSCVSNCRDCKAAYIGKTFKVLELEQRNMYALNNNNSSHFANHLRDSNHKFDINIDFKILHLEDRNNHLLNLEALESYKPK